MPTMRPVCIMLRPCTRRKATTLRPNDFTGKPWRFARRALDENHPDLATGLNSLARISADLGKHGQAEGLFREALQIRLASLGESHPDYATSLDDLAGMYRAKGEYTEAEPLYMKALEIRRAPWRESC